VPAAVLAIDVGVCLEAGDSNVGLVEVPASFSADGVRLKGHMLLGLGIFQPLLHPGAAKLRAIISGAIDL
jgi:hypothetical protein